MLNGTVSPVLTGGVASAMEIFSEVCLLPNSFIREVKTMFHFTAKFLQKPTATTKTPDVPTGDAAKTTTNDQLKSRLLKERQLHAMNEPQQCARRWR